MTQAATVTPAKVTVTKEEMLATRGADCSGLGCQARHTCPIGYDCRHEPAQAAFHMAAFVQARTSPPLVTAR
jgi:hypothetical protein